MFVGQLIDEHVARVLRRVGVERRHGDALFARLLQHRGNSVQIDRREFDRVRLLRKKVLQRLNLQTDVRMVGPRVDELVAEFGRGSLPAFGRGLEIGEAGPLRRHHDLETGVLGESAGTRKAQRQSHSGPGEPCRMQLHCFLLLRCY
jgi:hypothetical protein